MCKQNSFVFFCRPTGTASPSVDVPEMSGFEVEIGPDSTNDIYTSKFQVSPVHETGNESIS